MNEYMFSPVRGLRGTRQKKDKEVSVNNKHGELTSDYQ